VTTKKGEGGEEKSRQQRPSCYGRKKTGNKNGILGAFPRQGSKKASSSEQYKMLLIHFLLNTTFATPDLDAFRGVSCDGARELAGVGLEGPGEGHTPLRLHLRDVDLQLDGYPRTAQGMGRRGCGWWKFLKNIT
jgi:hypothetical protein